MLVPLHRAIRWVAYFVGVATVALWFATTEWSLVKRSSGTSTTQELWKPAPFVADDKAAQYAYWARCQAPVGRDEADICQQWRMAVAAEESATYAKYNLWLVGSGSLLFLAITSFFAGRAATWAKHAAIATEQTWRATERPWLAADAKVLSVRVTEQECFIEFQCSVKNVGNAPASDIVVMSFGATTGRQADQFVSEFAAAFDEHNGGFALFPNQSATGVELVQRVFINRSDLAPSLRENWFFPGIVVVLKYRSPNHGTFHLTTISKVLGLKSRNPYAPRALEWVYETYGEEELDLMTRHVGDRVT